MKGTKTERILLEMTLGEAAALSKAIARTSRTGLVDHLDARRLEAFREVLDAAGGGVVLVRDLDT